MCSLPNVRQIVVLKMDPVESVMHLDNPELTAACQKMQPKSYVGWVYSSSGLFNRELPYHYFMFYLLHQGLRPKDETPGSRPEMSVPVLPNTEHPLSRKPLDPGQPLPWDNCYVSPNFSIGGRCPTIWLPTKPPNLYITSIAETVRVGGLIDWDIHAQNEIVEELKKDKTEEKALEDSKLPEGSGEAGGAPAHEDGFSIASLDESSHRPLEGSSSSAGTNPNHKHEARGSQDFSPLDDSLEAAETTGGPQHPLSDDVGSKYAASGSAQVDLDLHYLDEVVLKVSHDLNLLDQVNDPAEFVEELETFERLVEQLETNRKKRKIEDARVADEAYFAKMAERPTDSSIPADSSTPVIPMPEPQAQRMSRMARFRLKGLRKKRDPSEQTPTSTENTKPEPKPNAMSRVLGRVREESNKALQRVKGSTGALRRTFCF